MASKTAYLLIILIWIFMPVPGKAQDTPVFDRLKQRFVEDYIFNANFTHEYHDTFTGEKQVTKGIIWVGKEKYKIQNGDDLMVVDGEISRVYDSSRNRVIISDYIEEEDDFAPSRMLQGVDDSYSVSEHQTDDGQTEVELTSEDPFSIFLRVSIFINSSGVPTRIEAVDQVENELITSFDQGTFIHQTPETFWFQYPEDAEEIDLRQGS